MLLNYLKIAWRSLRKQKIYSLINVLGLAVGMAVCLLILLYVQDELAYDDHHTNADRVYRVTRTFTGVDGEVSLHLSQLAPPFAALLEQELPEIERAVRTYYGGRWLFQAEDGHPVLDEQVMYAEHDVFDLFTVPFVAGDPRRALSDPYTLALSESLARRVFGDTDVVGRTVLVDNTHSYKVTGVYEDMPHTTHIPARAILSFATAEALYPDEFNNPQNWGSNNYGTYILLREGASREALEAKLPALMDEHMGGGTLDDGSEYSGSDWTMLHLQPLRSIHLHSHLDYEITANSDIRYVWLFSSIAVAILLIACVNFMNLATARSAGRAREVGLRKVIGANRRMLVGQFLGESFLITGLALALAVILVELVQPAFADLVGRPVAFSLMHRATGLPVLLAVWAGVGLLAGLYPAVYLSGFRPGRILRGELTRGARGAWTRKALVVSQFTVTIMLIIGVGAVLQQMRYIQQKTLGFEHENVIQIPGNSFGDEADLVLDRLQAHPGVLHASFSSRIPTGRLLDSGGASIEIDGDMRRYPGRLPVVRVDATYFSTYGIEVLFGRGFDPSFASDSLEHAVINETAARKAGFANPADAVGTRIVYSGQPGRIIGVTADFHFESLHQPITPVIFHLRPGAMNNLSVRAAPGQTPAVMALLEEMWGEYNENWPFRYSFLDDRIEALYRSEQQVALLTGWFAGLAVFIACLGLLGLAAYTAERRTKEIGIRKTLGASSRSIILLLSREFAWLVLLGNLIAWPLAWWGVHRWLEGFAYRTSPGMGLFLLAGLAALAVALVTVATQALRAASVHPVKALRHE